MGKLTVEMIEKTLKDKVDPVLEQHFGGASLTSYNDGVAMVKMTGACASCPSSKDTINNVIKDILCTEHSELVDVVLDDTVGEDLLDFAKSLLNKK